MKLKTLLAALLRYSITGNLHCCIVGRAAASSSYLPYDPTCFAARGITAHPCSLCAMWLGGGAHPAHVLVSTCVWCAPRMGEVVVGWRYIVRRAGCSGQWSYVRQGGCGAQVQRWGGLRWGSR